MSPDDADEILGLADLPGLSEAVLRRELRLGSPFHWVGVRDPAGALAGVHRSMRVGDLLFLKGVWVRDDARGTAAALAMAFFLRDLARARDDLAGVAAWASSRGAGRLLAERLRLAPAGPWSHRYILPVSGSAPAAVESAALPCGMRWLCERDRLAVMTGACSSLQEVDRLLVWSRGRGDDASRYVEFSAPAADVSLALRLVASGARRVSANPVRFAVAYEGAKW
jgi:hypothetical protein